MFTTRELDLRERLAELADDLSDEDTEVAALKICEHFSLYFRTLNLGERQDGAGFPLYIAMWSAFNESRGGHFKDPVPPIGRNGEALSPEDVAPFFDGIKSNLLERAKLQAFHSSKEYFQIRLDRHAAYEFSQGDLDRVQDLINELRTLLTNSTVIDAAHRERLLKQLERLQGELHKRMSSLSSFYGMIGDFGVVLGKFGDSVKPLTDRFCEMLRIVWSTQARAAELASNRSNELIALPSPDSAHAIEHGK
jgi:hypothetical protein